MPKKRKTTKKKTVAQNQQKAYMLGGFITILAVLSLLSLYSEQMGIFGTFMSSVIGILFGKVGSLFCALLFAVGLFFITDWNVKVKLKALGLALSVFLMAILYVYDPKTPSMTWADRIHSMGAAVDPGLIGENFARLVVGLLGTVGSWTLLVLIFSFLIYHLPSKERRVAMREKFHQFFQGKKEAFHQKQEADEKKEDPKRRKPAGLKTPIKKPFVQSSQEVFEEIIAEKRTEPSEAPVEIRDYRPIAKEKPRRADSLKETDKAAFAKDVQPQVSETIYHFPPLKLLKKPRASMTAGEEDVRKNAAIIQEVMDNFHVDCRVRAINRGPTITSYELEPSPGVKISKIVSLHDNLSLSLASPGIRIEAPIPGKSAIGIEVPNKEKDSVNLREIIESSAFETLDSNVPLTLGKDISGNAIVSSIDKMPHLLIAGATGSGKSVCINSILMGILYKSSPENVRLILIDPKVVELGIYNGIPHLLIPVVTDPKKAAFALAWSVDEMEKRYKAFAETGVRDITGYNEKMRIDGENTMPKIVIVVDELSDLMMVAAKEVEDYITRLAQMARAAGIHLILATQRPSVDVITGTIKANIPSRIAFSVSSSIDSRTILDMSGAEKLLGKGDMLFYPSSFPKPKRLQGAFVSDKEVEDVLSFVKNHTEETDYDDDALDTMEKKIQNSVSDEDPLLHEAIDIVLTQEQASISFIQRKLKVGYSRAARIVDQIEEMGIIGPHEGTKPRKLLMTKEQIEALKEEQENI
ncbi:MAG: DNA translocase FtsK [Peptoniphilus sp.]|nr:DNA translocase FtsK [Peptoniphilus sp.]MDY3119320.1 DNA translocase FtsK [Peptoniphilus sp.]